MRDLLGETVDEDGYPGEFFAQCQDDFLGTPERERGD